MDKFIQSRDEHISWNVVKQNIIRIKVFFSINVYSKIYFSEFEIYVSLDHEKWKSESESCSVVSNSLRPHVLYSLWNSPGQNTGVVAVPFSRVSSQPRGWTQVSCIADGFFTSWATRELSLSQNGQTDHVCTHVLCVCVCVGAQLCMCGDILKVSRLRETGWEWKNKKKSPKESLN